MQCICCGIESADEDANEHTVAQSVLEDLEDARKRLPVLLAEQKFQWQHTLRCGKKIMQQKKWTKEIRDFYK